jgi:hypothetical protein
MRTCTIKIIPENPDGSGNFKVSYNEIPSHTLERDSLNGLIKTAGSDFWLYNDQRCKELGKELFTVMDGTAGRLNAEISKASDESRMLALRLDLPPVLDDLPFEIMFHNGFLTLDREITILRLVSPKGAGKKPDPAGHPLKVLFMACAPDSAGSLNFEQEEEMILRETEKLHLHLDVEDSGSCEGLTDMVRWIGGVDVAHLTGHAGLDETDGPVFCMEDEIGQLDKVSPQRLAGAFRGLPPRILFLSGCSTGMRDAGLNHDRPAFTVQMVASGIPFVMGWARPVTDIGATVLAASLFKYLAIGNGIARAVLMARQDVRGVHDTWKLFRVYACAEPPGPIIQSGMGIRPPSRRNILYRTLQGSHVEVLEQGFVGRRKQIQQGIRVLRGFCDQKGLLITGAAGVGKSCLSGKLMERFQNKKPVVVRGRLDPPAFLNQLISFFEQEGHETALKILHGEKRPEERIEALFRQAFKDVPCIIYLDDFEKNLPDAGELSSEKQNFTVIPESLPLVRSLLNALPWADGKTSLIISSRYPFRLEHRGENLPETRLVSIPLMSMQAVDLKKMGDNLPHIFGTPHKELYLAAGKGNPRLLQWLEKIAAEEDQYDLTALKTRVQGKQADYVAEYLFEIMAEKSGPGFDDFLRRASVYRIPAEIGAFALFGSPEQIQRAAWLTLLEKESRPSGDLYQVHPMIRETEWEKLPQPERQKAHEAAANWYDQQIQNNPRPSFARLSQSVHHALSAGRVRLACGHAVRLGNMMKNMQLYHSIIKFFLKRPLRRQRLFVL